MTGPEQQSAGSAAEATQGAEARLMIAGAEASVWTERMLSALGNGVVVDRGRDGFRHPALR